MPSKKSPPAAVRHAVIGGSGIYKFEGMNVRETFYPDTPFGKPSDPITIGEIQGVRCAFLPRHGQGHRFLPREIPQRANFFALKLLGVEHVVALSACGSLKEEIAPRHFVVPDQLIDRTCGRESTFFGSGIVAHISFARPFSETLSAALADSVRRVGVPLHPKATYLCMEGPAFSTKAESHLHRQMGCDLIGMTALPEAKLARESEMSYALLAMATDYDSWKENDEVSVQLVIENLTANAENAKKVVADLVPRLAALPNDCSSALAGAIFTDPSVITSTAKKRLHPLIKKYVNERN